MCALFTATPPPADAHGPLASKRTVRVVLEKLARAKRDRTHMTDKNPHPHFDDHGALSWHTRYADALSQAKRENKTLFIEMGREA